MATADDVERSKPAGDIFASALKKVSASEPAIIIATGDTPYEVVAAQRCGLQTIGVQAGGFSKEVLVRAGAVSTFSAVEDLLNIHSQH